MTSSTTTELLLVVKTPLVQLDKLATHFGLSDHNFSMYAKCEFLQYGGHGSVWNRWAKELLYNLPLSEEQPAATDRVKFVVQKQKFLLNIHWPSSAEKLEQCDDENAEKEMQLGWHCWPIVHALCTCAVTMGMHVQLTVQKGQICRHQQIKNTLSALGVQIISSVESDCKHCSNSDENVFCLRLIPQQKRQEKLFKDDGNIFNSLMCKAYRKTMEELVKELKCQLGRMLPDCLAIDHREFCPPFMSIEEANAFWSELAEKEGGRMKVICCNEQIASHSANGHHHIVNGVPNNNKQQLKNSISTVCANSSTIDAVHSALGCLEGMLYGRGSAIAVAGALQSQQLSASKFWNGNSHESRCCVILLADGILHSTSADSDSFNMQNDGKSLLSSNHLMDGLFNNELDQQNGFKMGKEQSHQHNNEAVGTMAKNNEQKQLKSSLISENETNLAHGTALPNILHAIGQTPLLQLNGIVADLLSEENCCVDIFSKCEFANPGGSTKDRVALSMVNKQIAEMEKEVKKEKLTIIEPTAGNTGIGLAMVAAVYGLRCICVMPQKMSADKERLLCSLGAQIVRTPNTTSTRDPESYISMAHRMAQQMQRQNKHQKPKALCLDQCNNVGNPQAHYEGTGAEIVAQMEGRRIDALVIGAATGGTLTGIGRRVREKFPECKIIAVEPCGSGLSKNLFIKRKHRQNNINNNRNLKKEEVLLDEVEETNADQNANFSAKNSYKLEGLGLDFVPAVFEPGLVDQWIRVRDVDAFRMARLLNRRGIPCGGSSGAALWATLEVARQMGEKNMKNPKNGQRSALVTLFPDGMRNYLSTFLDDGWLIENGFSELLDEKQCDDHSNNGNNTINVNENFHTVEPPMELSKPMNIQKVALFGSGPTELCERVYNAMQNPMLSPLNPQFLQVLEDVKLGLKYMFQTKNALTFAVSGTGHAGLECALVNLLEHGQRLLVLENGRWGQCVHQIANRIPNIYVHSLQVPWGQTVPLQMFEKAIREFQPHLVYVCHGESSTGVLQTLDGFGQACHAHGALLLVDAVASLGVVPLEADMWELDCVFAASQKVLNCPPGLAPITFSERAIAKIKVRKTPVSSYYFDALELGSMWNCCAESSVNGDQSYAKRKFHHTLPITMLYALRECLALFVEDNGGLAASWELHRRAAEYLRHKLVDELGLELFVKEECNRLPSMTTVIAPPGFADDPLGWDLFSDGMLENGFELSNGLGALCNRVWRIAMFGQQQTANVAKIDALLEAIKQQMTLKQQQKRKQ